MKALGYLSLSLLAGLPSTLAAPPSTEESPCAALLQKFPLTPIEEALTQFHSRVTQPHPEAAFSPIGEALHLYTLTPPPVAPVFAEIIRFPKLIEAEIEAARREALAAAKAGTEEKIPLEVLPKPFEKVILKQLKDQNIPLQEFIAEFYDTFYDPLKIYSAEEWAHFQKFSATEAEVNKAVVRLLRIVWWPTVQFASLVTGLESDGEVIFEQKRIGYHGLEFTIKKLRTMYTGISGTSFTQKNDRRVTRTGKFFRKTKIDEFLQFYNILDGDMNIIGRRPIVPVEAFAALLEDPRYGWTWLEKPALAGQGQVRSEHCSTANQNLAKAEHDLHYMMNKSLPRVVRLVFETVWTILRGRSP